MAKKRKTESRKGEHVKLVTERDVAFHTVATGFERLHFIHNALPELALDEIDTSTQFFGRHLEYPLLISSMTGGYEEATNINRELARIAFEFEIAIGVGSTRQALEDTRFHASYSVVREEFPGGLLFSNIGAAEVARLAREHSIRSLAAIIELVRADALVIHLNPLQELLQPEGSPDFRGVLKGIAMCVSELSVPIVVKEVGSGISRDVARCLIEVGVRAIDVAGAGGTSWAAVEILRHKKKDRDTMLPFRDWGIPTVDSLIDVAELKKHATFGLISSGGITNGLDVAKSIALGADLAALARPLMVALMIGGPERVRAELVRVTNQLRYAMFLTGSRDLSALARQPLRRVD